jgi:U3 small nucleolar RNA-associated protein 12
MEVWELGSGALLQKIQAHDGEIWAMDLRANGRGLATGGGDKQLKCWDFELLIPKEAKTVGGVAAPSVKRLSLVHTRTLKLTEVVMSLKHSPDGKYLAAGLLDSTVKVFFEDSLKFFLSLYGHKLPVL